MMTRKNYSSKKGGRKTNKRGMKKRGGFSWSSLNPFAKKTENDTNVSSTAPAPIASSIASSTAPTAPAPEPTCPPCPVCQQPVPPAVAQAIKEEEPSSSAPPALESQLGGGKKRKTRRNRTKKCKKSKKLWFQIGCVKI